MEGSSAGKSGRLRQGAYQFIFLAHGTISLLFTVCQRSQRFCVGLDPSRALLQVGPCPTEGFGHRESFHQAFVGDLIEHHIVDSEQMSEQHAVGIDRPRLWHDEIGQGVEQEPFAADQDSLKHIGDMLVPKYGGGVPKDFDVAFRACFSLCPSCGED